MIPMVHQEDHLTCLNDLNVGPFTLQPQLHSQRFFCELGIFLQSARANALANAKHIAQNVAISIDLYRSQRIFTGNPKNESCGGPHAQQTSSST